MQECSARCGILESDRLRPPPAQFVRTACRFRALRRTAFIDWFLGPQGSGADARTRYAALSDVPDLTLAQNTAGLGPSVGAVKLTIERDTNTWGPYIRFHRLAVRGVIDRVAARCELGVGAREGPLGLPAGLRHVGGVVAADAQPVAVADDLPRRVVLGVDGDQPRGPDQQVVDVAPLPTLRVAQRHAV